MKITEKITEKNIEKPSDTRQDHTEQALRGTFAAVLIMMAVLVSSWLAVFFLFLHRQ
ncbi:cytochrome c oxidase subunit 2A [Paenibacillus whitsoniae]|uniref:cytochrome c oxidase subunit 2A n=1 Tax=Paenibacillus whitsoniae TaxID=2496558 RepID=UPI001F49DEC5|nr:cytochrome c oxidase subunit 2A [Paenibacillus whitsoniae]